MKSFTETLALWVSTLGAFLGLLGALQSVSWLIWFGGVLVVAAIAAIIYAREQRLRLESVVLKVAGRSIDSLNMATLRRRRNRTLVVQEAHNFAVIDGEDLQISWECFGYCRGGEESNFEFSIDSDNNIPFDALDCFAFDLKGDPARRHRIRPILVGPDGISKKIAIPFLAPLKSGESFYILLICRLPGCMKEGVDYYTASLSFAQSEAIRYSLDLQFVGGRPKWLRAYEVGPAGKAKLLKDLKPEHTPSDRVRYQDGSGNAPADSIRIYMFERSLLRSDHDEHFASAAIGSR